MCRMKTAVRILLVAALLGGVTLLGLGSGGSKNSGTFPSPTGSPDIPLPVQCVEPLPPAIGEPKFFPKDLPIPEGSYASLLIPGGTADRVVYTVKAPLRDFVTFIIDAWPKASWELGRGESEPGEAESSMRKGKRIGVFRARSVYCDQAWTEVLFAFGTIRPPQPPR